MNTKDIRINAKLIRRYDPCLGGLANFKKHYKDISIKELINSKKISYDDKIWLLKRIVNIDLLALWAIDNSIASYKNSVCYGVYVAAADSIIDKAADYPEYISRFAYYTAAYAASYAASDSISWNKAKKERLQSLLYFIENEE